MKIGIDGRALTEKRAGIGMYTYEIIKELNSMDNKNEYYIYSNKKIFLDFDLNNNFHKCEYVSKIGTFWLYFKLPKILYDDNISVFWGTQHCLPKNNKYTEKIKYILTIHDLAIFKLKNMGSVYNTIVQHLIVKKSCKNANKIIAISNSTKNDIREIFKISEEKIKVIYNGFSSSNKDVDENIKTKILEKYKISNTRFVFFLSTIEPRKNLNTAIRAFELYKENNKDNLKFIISGGIGWKCQDTLNMIKNSKYSDDIIQTGYISKEEKQVFFEECEAFIYPSLYEGFGLPILEAMSKKSIVITTNVSSMPEVGGNAAFYINDAYDFHELELKFEEVISLSENEKREKIELGLLQAQKFSWKNCAEGLYKAFYE